MKVFSDNADIVSRIEKLAALFIAEGGTIHDDIAIVHKGTQFHVEALNPIANGTKLIDLPPPCLIPIDRFRYTYDGSKVSIHSYSSSVTKAQADMMEIMVDLYNLSDKKNHILNHTMMGVFLNDRPLYTRLIGWDTAIDPKEFKNLSKDEICFNYFKKVHALTKNNEQMWLPVVDFFNHHTRAHKVKTDNQENLITSSFMPEGQNQIFIQYNFLDARDIFLMHGYAGKTATFVRSKPLTIKLSEKRKIISTVGVFVYKEEETPKESKDLRIFIPGFNLNNERTEMKTSSILIPGKTAPQALRRVLDILIYEFGIPDAERSRLILSAESQIIRANVEYYEALVKDLTERTTNEKIAPMLSGARKMAEIQLARLKNYPFYEDAMKHA